MKALLLKDYYNLKKSLKTFGIVIAFYCILGIFSGVGSTISSMVAFLCAVLPISSFSYDEFAKWDSYALSIPISRKEIILEKYVLSLLMVFAGTAMGMTAGVVSNLVNDSSRGAFSWDVLTLGGGSAIAAIFIISLLLPILVKLGTEKGRIAMLGIFLIPAALVMIVIKSKTLSSLLGSLLPSSEVIDSLLVPAACAGIVGILLLLVGSYFLSLHFMNQKEF